MSNTLLAECLEWTPRQKEKYGDINGRTDKKGRLLPRDTEGKDFLTEYYEGDTEGKLYEANDYEWIHSESFVTKEEQDKEVIEWFEQWVSSISSDDEVEHILCSGLGTNRNQTLEWHRGERKV